MSLRTRFFLGVAVLTTLFLSGIIVLPTYKPEWVSPYATGLLIYNVVLAIISYEVVALGAKGNVMSFYNFFMGATTARLFMGLALFLAYFVLVQDAKVDRVIFAVNFFLLYFSFTVFEIIHLFSKLRQNSVED